MKFQKWTLLILITLFFILIVVPTSFAGIENCKRVYNQGDDYKCGQCEEKLQISFDSLLKKTAVGGVQSVEDFLAQLDPILKKNYMIIGDSKSNQTTAKDKYRYVLKSPESEVLVAFTEDPKAPGGQTIEVIRWDGKNAKYKFESIDFSKGKAQVDLSGKNCVHCHKENLRPNFDDYPAWTGFLPPKLDVVDRESSQVGSPPTPSSQAYLDTMKRIAIERDHAAQGKPPSRLSFLNIPYVDTDPRPATPLTDTQKIKAIEKSIQNNTESKGGLFGYRIPHDLAATQIINNSAKTSSTAGPAAFTFDQLVSQQVCQITNRLKEDPNFSKFKYALSGIILCKNTSLFDYLKSDVDRDERRENQKIISNKLKKIREQMTEDENKTNAARQERHFKFLTETLNMGKTQSELDSKKIASESDDQDLISQFRVLLEPFGVRTGDWSMSFGDRFSENHYTFADQLKDEFTNNIAAEKSFIENEAVEEFRRKKTALDYDKLCSWLKTKSRAQLTLKDLTEPKEIISDHSFSLKNIISVCQNIPEHNAGIIEALSPLISPAQTILRKQALHTFSKCMECHRPSGEAGPKNTFPTSQSNQLATFLKTKKRDSGKTWLETIFLATSPQSEPGVTHMPRNNQLQPEERAIFLGWLVSMSLGLENSKQTPSCEALTLLLAKKPQGVTPEKEPTVKIRASDAR